MGSLASKSNINPDDIVFLTENTQYNCRQVLEWFESFKREYPAGHLTQDQFVKMYSKFFPEGNSEDFCKHVFRVFDMNKNGIIEFREFLLAIDITSSIDPEKKLKCAFSLYDVNGNGVITKAEMEQVVTALFKMRFSEKDEGLKEKISSKTSQMFSAMDLDKDGTISQDEFVAACNREKSINELLQVI